VVVDQVQAPAAASKDLLVVLGHMHVRLSVDVISQGNLLVVCAIFGSLLLQLVALLAVLDFVVVRHILQDVV
jgi:hypothetical protein